MKKLQLMITNPCSESWDEMKPHGKGRYCDSCEKNIVDLTDKSDQELIEFFKTKKDSVCGRLHPNQLNRQMVMLQQKPRWPWLVPLAIGAIAISPAQASEVKHVVTQVDFTSTPKTHTEPVGNQATDTIAGKVIDEQTGAPLAGVKIRQKGFQNVLAITDIEGKFKVSKAQDGVKILTFEHSGYRYVEVAAISDMQVRLLSDTRLILGRISAVQYSSEPFYILHAGKKSCVIDSARLRSINPEWIEDVTILEGAKAAALYGSKAANGAVAVRIKKEHAKNFEFSRKE